MSDTFPEFSAVQAAARLLEQGELVAFPTETVYGLGADAENPAAVARIYAAKGRPATHPVIVHLAPEADLGHWAAEIPAEADRLIKAFWPGPLTLILKRNAAIPAAVSGGQDSIGLRCPSHPVALALLREFKAGKGGIGAPSANRFGHVSPTTARHVYDEFGEGPCSALACVLDGGPSEVGIESTILDLSRLDSHGPVLLRPGHIDIAALAAVLGRAPGLPDAAAPRASGTLDAHYAPTTPLALVATNDLSDLLQSLAVAGRQAALIRYTSEYVRGISPLRESCLPATPETYARGLYAALRSMDRAGADIIIVEQPPADLAWHGINDRLRRAAFDSAGAIERLTRIA